MSSTFLPSTQIGSLCSHCLWVGPEPGRGQQVADQLLPGSGTQHVLKDTDGLAALCMGRELEAGVDIGSWRKSSFKTHWHPAPGPKRPRGAGLARLLSTYPVPSMQWLLNSALESAYTIGENPPLAIVIVRLDVCVQWWETWQTLEVYPRFSAPRGAPENLVEQRGKKFLKSLGATRPITLELQLSDFYRINKRIDDIF